MHTPNRILATLALACHALASHANDAVPPAACQQALDALRVRESALIGARPAAPDASSSTSFQRRPDPQLLALRRSAAIACLGTDADSRPASAPRGAQAPITVAPIAGLQAPATPRLRPGAPAPATPTPPPTPTLVMSCDPTGCWTNTGSRLSRIGNDLWGPRGLCTVQGVSLHCP